MNHKNVLFMAMAAACMLAFSCTSPVSDTQELGVVEAKTGLTVNAFFADYAAMSNDSESRVLDRRTVAVKLYLNGVFFSHQEISLLLTPGGSNWTGSFPIPVPIGGTYSSVKLVFVDASDNPLTQGEKLNVSVAPNQNISMVIGCIPSVFENITLATVENSKTLSMANGAVVYYKFAATAGKTTRFVLSGIAGDLFIFDLDGRFRIGAATTLATETLEFSPTVDGSFWLALYANAAGSARMAFSQINKPPVANAGKDQIALTSETLAFDGSSSRDPEGTSLSYVWDFGDGSTATGINVSHSFVNAGTYDVELTVTDILGATATATMKAYIGESNIAPIADAGIYGGTYIEGDDLTLDASGSYDVNAEDTLSYSWVVEKAEGASWTSTGIIPGSAGPTANFEFLLSGEYRVTVTVTDATASASAISYLSVIENEAPIVTLQLPASTIGINESVTFGVLIEDEDGQANATVSWNFGDGETDSGLAPSHSYSDAGTYTVSVNVTDMRGKSTVAQADILVQQTFSFSIIPPVDAGSDGKKLAFYIVDRAVNDVGVWGTIVQPFPGTIEVPTGNFTINAPYKTTSNYFLVVMYGTWFPGRVDLMTQGLDEARAAGTTVAFYSPAAADGTNLMYGLTPTQLDALASSSNIVPDTTYSMTLVLTNGDLQIDVE